MPANPRSKHHNVCLKAQDENRDGLYNRVVIRVPSVKSQGTSLKGASWRVFLFSFFMNPRVRNVRRDKEVWKLKCLRRYKV